MIDDDQEFLRDLLHTFREDAEERIKLLSQAVVELEAAGESKAASAPIEVLYRETHSLKGAAGAVEQAQMEVICQNVESLLAALKTGDVKPTQPVVDALSESVDCLHSSLLAESGADERTHELVDRLSTLVSSGSKRSAKKPARKSAKKSPEKSARTPSQTTSGKRYSCLTFCPSSFLIMISGSLLPSFLDASMVMTMVSYETFDVGYKLILYSVG